MITFPITQFAKSKTQDIISGLVLHLQLTETSGNAIDSSPIGNDGAPSTPAPTQTATGAVFNGVDTFFTLNQALFPTTDAFTFSAIYNGVSLKNWNCILGIDTYSPDFTVRDYGALGQAINIYHGGDIDSTKNLVISDGNDHRVTIIRTGLGTNETAFYLDHVAVGAATYPNTFNPTTRALVGGSDDTDAFLDGKIRDVRFYTRALTATQELALPNLSIA